MQMSLGFHSTMFYGTRSFDNVSRESWEDIDYYDYEEYSVDYKNGTFSAGFNYSLSFNWINKKNFILRQTSKIFVEIYDEKLNYTLTHFEEDSSYIPSHYLNELNLNESNFASINGVGWGAFQELIYLHKLDNSWNIGGGLSYNWMRRDDRHFQYSWDYYAPNHTRLTWGRYTTQQLGVVFHVEKVYSDWSIFFNFNQAVLTLKSQRNKGGDYMNKSLGEHINPISHNLDFRFPLYIQFGASWQFKKLKR